MTDADLIRQHLRSPGGDAFAQLVDRHGAMVHATARRLAREEADDVAQAVFIVLARKASSLASRDSIAGWLYETTRQCARNARRGQYRRQALVASYQEQHVTPDPSPPDPEMLTQLDNALAALPARYREVLLMRYMEDQSVEATAKRLSLSPSAVLKQTTRGLERVRDFFARHGVATTAQGVAGCMTTQIAVMSSIQRAGLLHAASGSAASAAVGIAGGVGKSMLVSKLIAAAVAFVVSAGVIMAGVKLLQLSQRHAEVPNARIPPVVAQLSPATNPTATQPAAPVPTTADPRKFADEVVAIILKDDPALLAPLMNAETPEKRLEMAKKCLDESVHGIYKKYPSRLSIEGFTQMVDGNNQPLSAQTQTRTPFNASVERLALYLVPVNGQWRINMTEIERSTLLYHGNRVDLAEVELPPGDHFDYGKAHTMWLGLFTNSIAPGDLKPEQVPQMIAELENNIQHLHELDAYLKPTRLAIPENDVRQ